jgi:hypothetical protein
MHEEARGRVCGLFGFFGQIKPEQAVAVGKSK